MDKEELIERWWGEWLGDSSANFRLDLNSVIESECRKQREEIDKRIDLLAKNHITITIAQAKEAIKEGE